jgi:tetratricopeptide (TPR) repeat protein
LWVEKIPLFLLSAVFCAITIWAQQEAIAVKAHLSFSLRIANAVVAVIAYLKTFFYPMNLSVLYPHPGNQLPLWQIWGAAACLASIGLSVWMLRRRCPAWSVGWLWSLGMLLPVLGLVQVGEQSMADRYTYLPQIGLCIALVWGVLQLMPCLFHSIHEVNSIHEINPTHREGEAPAEPCLATDSACQTPYFLGKKLVLGVIAVSILATLAWGTRKQIDCWNNSIVLWNHVLACEDHNAVAHYNLGVALVERGQVDEAMTHYCKAIEIRPDYAEAHFNLGVIFDRRGVVDEAIAHYQKATEAAADFSEAHNNLGILLAAQGDFDGAIEHDRKAVEILPGFAEAHNNLANALNHVGQIAEAIEHYELALKHRPNYAEAENNYGVALQRSNHYDAAIPHFRQAIAMKPDYVEAYDNLGTTFGLQGHISEAMAAFEKALALNPHDVDAHNKLGMVLGQQGKLAEAAAHFQRVLQLQPNHDEARRNLGIALSQESSIPDANALETKTLDRNSSPAQP